MDPSRFDHADSEDDAKMQRALRMLHSGPAPDFVARVAAASPAECDEAAERAEHASASGRRLGLAGPLLYAAIVILGLGITSYLMIERPSRPDEFPASIQDPKDLRRIAGDPKRRADFATWRQLCAVLDDVRSVTMFTRPCYRDTANSFRTSSHLTLQSKLDAKAARELVDACRAAKPSDGGFPPSLGEYRWLELEFTDGRWTKIMVLPSKTRGNMLLTLNVERAEVAMPAAVLAVAASMTGQLNRRWVRITELTDVANATNDVEAVLFDKAPVDTIQLAMNRLPLVRKVEVRGAPLDDALLASLGRRGAIQELSLTGVEETSRDVQLEALRAMTRVRRLELAMVEFDPGDLTRFPELRDLTLSACRIKQPGLSLLAQMPIHTLALRRMEGLGVAAVASLGSAVRMRSLEIEVTSLDELRALAEATKAMRALAHLHVRFPRQFRVVGPRDYFEHLNPAKTHVTFFPDSD